MPSSSRQAWRAAGSLRDQNRLVYQADQDFAAGLPEELQGPMTRWFERFMMGREESCDCFRNPHRAHGGKRRVKIQRAPANLHWCSEASSPAMTGTG